MVKLLVVRLLTAVEKEAAIGIFTTAGTPSGDYGVAAGTYVAEQPHISNTDSIGAYGKAVGNYVGSGGNPYDFKG